MKTKLIKNNIYIFDISNIQFSLYFFTVINFKILQFYNINKQNTLAGKIFFINNNVKKN